MFSVLKLCSRQVNSLFAFVCALLLVALVPAISNGQRSKGAADSGEDKPVFIEFRGVRLGMTADDARKKLGSPRDKGADQDFYVFNDNEAVEVYYDQGAVKAISIDFMSGANGVPTSKDVLGVEVAAKADGSIFKLVRYPKAGYWVSYSRTAGTDPTITITIQKIQ